jgi:Transposase IS4
MNSTAQETRSSTRQRRATWKIREQDEFIPIVVEPLPSVTKPILSDPIPQFEPESRVPFDSMRPVIPCTDPLYLFLFLFGEQTLAAIVVSTNAYANFFTQKPHPRRPRPWHDLTRNELLQWIGTLFYMGRHPEHNIEYYWRPQMHHFGRYMSKTRWEQIHRFITINTQERQMG